MDDNNLFSNAKRCRSKSAALSHKTHKTEAPRQSN
ncbi:hypothetical protein ACO22_07743 [Paracoccidioides brasiliensis]|uniref:Uncharacterized protein n=1 Tax=Paracoccidioides brasiliensis TaxID=121759 RepID=A0A1D2J3U4_PARBR|nr:hypothetical protein ACO22_07743 [Paracoccidioides brasiliensis]